MSTYSRHGLAHGIRHSSCVTTFSQLFLSCFTSFVTFLTSVFILFTSLCTHERSSAPSRAVPLKYRPDCAERGRVGHLLVVPHNRLQLHAEQFLPCRDRRQLRMVLLTDFNVRSVVAEVVLPHNGGDRCFAMRNLLRLGERVKRL